MINGSLTLEGGDGLGTGSGQVTLSDSDQNKILSGGFNATLTNVDNTISGSGTIGDGHLTLDNQLNGVIDATGITPLILNSDIIRNEGLLEATGNGTLQINGNVVNAGTLEADGGTLALGSSFSFFETSGANEVVTLAGGGTLQLADTGEFGGAIAGFATSDVVDSTDFALNIASGSVIGYSLDSWDRGQQHADADHRRRRRKQFWY